MSRVRSPVEDPRQTAFLARPSRVLPVVGEQGDIAYIDQPVKVIPLSEGKGKPYEAPTYEGVAAATYPLSRLVFFNTNKAPGKPLNPALDEFLKFILSKEGQQIVLDHARYIPLRASQAQDARTLLAK